MRKISLLIIISLFIGCRQKDNVPAVTDSLSLSDSVDRASKNLDRLAQNLDVPDGIRLDTLKSFDSTKLLNIEIVLPKHKNPQLMHVDRVLSKIIQNKKNEFEKSVDEMIREHPNMNVLPSYNDFTVTPVSLFMNNRLLSFSFMICIYHASAPHGKCEYYTFNYDLIDKKAIKFSDYFICSTQSDSAILIQKINSAIGQDGIGIEKLYEIDFNILDSTLVSFNFDNYEITSYSEGMPQGIIRMREIVDNIGTRYR